MIVLLMVICVIVIDQFTKWIVIEKLMGKSSFVVIKNLLEFKYIENRGAAFGILQGRSILLILVTLTVSFLIIYYLVKHYGDMSLLLRLSLGLILAGALGNLIDRIIRGYVVDFIFVRFWGLYDFPIFNVADISVVVGSILLFYLILFTKELGD